MGVQLHDFTSADGARWKINSLPATVGLRCLTQIIGMIGEPLGIISGKTKQAPVKAADEDVLTADFGDDALPKAIAVISRNIADESSVALVKTLTQGLFKNEKAVNFDLEFASSYRVLLMEIVPWVLRINFADFFGEGLGALGSLNQLRALAQTPATSTGKSGG